MHLNLTNRKAESLVEIEVTLHPAALHHAFLGRNGYFWRFLRLLLGFVLFLLAVGGEIAWPRFFPEVPLHPLWLLIAYLGCNSTFFLALASAWCGGFLLDAGCALLPGRHVLPFLLAAFAMRILRILPAWRGLGGWGRAAFAGAAGHLFLAAYEALFLSFGIGWNAWLAQVAHEIALGTILAAFAAAPVLFFCVDCLASLGNGQPIFLPRASTAPPNLP